MTLPAVSPDVRRVQLLSLALDYATTRDVEKTVAEAARIGVDLLDPYSMAAVSVLGDCLAYGIEPSKRALAVLGCEQVA